MVARRVHIPEVTGSNPVSAIDTQLKIVYNRSINPDSVSSQVGGVNGNTVDSKPATLSSNLSRLVCKSWECWAMVAPLTVNQPPLALQVRILSLPLFSFFMSSNVKGYIMGQGTVKRRWFVAEAKTGYILEGTSERGYGRKEIAAEFRAEVDEANRRKGKFVPAELIYGYAVDA